MDRDAYPTLEALEDAMRSCTDCELSATRTQVVPGTGPADARVLLLGEGPGASEDREGIPFVGRGGALLDRLLEEAGVSREDVYITNVVACRPPRNRNPRVGEVRAHAPWLEEQLRLIGPELVVTLGRVPLIYFIKGAKITQIHGQTHPLTRAGRSFTLLPTFHPAAALRARGEVMEALAADLAQIPALLAGS